MLGVDNVRIVSIEPRDIWIKFEISLTAARDIIEFFDRHKVTDVGFKEDDKRMLDAFSEFWEKMNEVVTDLDNRHGA